MNKLSFLAKKEVTQLASKPNATAPVEVHFPTHDWARNGIQWVNLVCIWGFIICRDFNYRIPLPGPPGTRTTTVSAPT
eukprot:8557314-Lingulodinium_polyedra.AAC.1